MASALRALGTWADAAMAGIAAAVVVTDGETLSELGPVALRAWTPAERRVLAAGGVEAVELGELAHAELISTLAPPEVIGFAGLPAAGRRPGDGALLAEVLDCPVVWDVEAADRALGGLGGAMPAFFLHALLRDPAAAGPVAVVGLDRVAELTWMDPRRADPLAPGACLAFEAGPAGAMLSGAGGGRIDRALLDRLLAEPWFHQPPPRRLPVDRDAALADALGALDPATASATGLALVAGAVIRALDLCPAPPVALHLYGRGASVLAPVLSAGAGLPAQVFAGPGPEARALPAQAMAFLAVRALRGLPTSGPATTGVAAAVGGAAISRPGATVQT